MNAYLVALHHPGPHQNGLVRGPGVLSALRNALRTLFADVARSRRLARAQAEIDALDDATLRDIGLQRSEAGSYWAESERLVEQTRLRLLRQMHASA